MSRLIAALLVAASLSACASTNDNAGALSETFGSSRDTYGTQRRPDVDYQFTRPTMPTMQERFR